MQDIPSLIEKYWAGTATMEEKSLLLQLLSDDHAALKQWLQREYESDIADSNEILSEQRSAELLEMILKKKQKVIPLQKRWPAWAAAALITLLAGAALLKFYARPTETEPKSEAKTETKALKHITNTGKSKMTIHLEDSSTVVLLPQSSLSYYPSFGPSKRDIRLEGKAWFNVAKDPSRPFTVFADNIATTVLGTDFTVDALTGQKVIVRLLSGKVVVRSAGASMPDVYLKPGQEASIDEQRMVASVSRFDHQEDSPPLVFDKTPLPQVFDRLGRKYHMRFIYERNDIKGLQFTGAFLKKDSLQMMMSVICNMNGLAFKTDSGTIAVHKVN